MNEFGDRLNTLAGRATTGVSVNDPSVAAVPVADRQPKRRGMAMGLVAALAVLVMLFLWQSSGSSSTSVASGEGADALAAAEATPCAVQSLVDVLRSGVPTFDYDPIGSYAALAESALIAVSGSIVSAERVDLNGTSFIELGLDDVIELTTGVAQPDVMMIAYEAVWSNRSARDPILDLALSDDARFVGFLSPWSGIRGGWNPSIEGLYVSCGDGGPLQAVLINASGGDDPSQPNRSELKALLADEEPIDPNNPGERPAQPSEAEPPTAAELAGLQRATISIAQGQWQSLGLENYRLRYSEFQSEGMASPADLRIEAGRLVADESLDVADESARRWTVDEMFAAARSADTVREFEFDPTTGAPTEPSLDPDRTVSGDEFAFRSIQMVSQSDLDSIDETLADWLPAPVDSPAALRAILDSKTQTGPTQIDQV